MRYDDAMARVKISLFLLAILLAGGCDEALETGYKPRRLNDSDADRKAYYAPEFTPESHPPKDAGSAPDLMPQR
jgi:hypothetical protein